MDRPRLTYGDKRDHGAGWSRLVTLDGTVTFAVEVVQGRPKQSEWGWGHDWHATVLDTTGTTVFRGRVKKGTGLRSILERAGLMGSVLADGRRLDRGGVVVAWEDGSGFSVFDPARGQCHLVTTSRSIADQRAGALDWAKLQEAEA